MGGCWAVVFQFHKGTIKTAFNQKPTRYSSDFNSIKVRLKLSTYQWYIRLHIFQFHKGTIKTGITLLKFTKLFHFNSIKVRLKQDAQAVIDNPNFISIP